MSSDYAIKVENLNKCYQIYDKPRDRLKQMLMGGRRQYYRKFWALREVSFKIKKGETVGIIGRNGSGKSTLLQMLCGTLNPTNGFIQTFGRIAALLELGSGFNPEFTGRENIYLNGMLLGLSREQISARFEDIVAFADIGDFIDQPVKSYSSGMYVRLAFAVVAHVDADILVVDEALAVGDAFFTQKCMRFLRTFMKTGTVLFVSHDTAAVKSLCTRAVWLENGKVIHEGDPKDVCDKYLEAFYEAQQGKGSVNRVGSAHVEKLSNYTKDHRCDFVNSSNLRNDLQVFCFDTESVSFGTGTARIVSVAFLDSDGDTLSWIVGGESVILRIDIYVHEELNAPIVGFFIKDRLGQSLFGDNTFLSYMDAPMVCSAGKTLRAEFFFQMPRLATGDYSVTVAVANGTQADHVQHHWIHDAIVFRSESTSVCGGLVGIPMADITLSVM